MAPSIDCHAQSMPFNLSYSNRPAAHSRPKTPAWTHCWKRSWAVLLGQMPVAFNAFHWQPVRRTKRIAFRHTRSSAGGHPPPKRCVFTRWGSNG